MTPLRAAWLEVPSVVKQAIAAIAGAVSAAMLLGAMLDLPARTTANEVAIDQHSQEIIHLQRGERDTNRTLDYLACLIEAQQGIGTRTALECANDRIRAER